MTTPSGHGWIVLKVGGEVDISRQDELEDLVAANCEGHRSDTVVDLTEVVFMDSTGLRWLMRTQDLLVDRGRRFSVVMPESLDRLLKISGFTESFDIHRSLEDATRTN